MGFRLRILCAAAGLVMCLGAGLAASQADQPNFSGKFEAKSGKQLFWGQRIQVAQSPRSVDVSWLRQGQAVTYHFPLDGSRSECSHEPDSSDPYLSNKCSGELKGSKLTLKIRYIHDRNGNPIETSHRIEEWELSKGSNTLTIRVPEVYGYGSSVTLMGQIAPTEFKRVVEP
jgi:hypothetical protein